jgi:hypothetical protein
MIVIPDTLTPTTFKATETKLGRHYGFFLPLSLSGNVVFKN